MQRQTSGVSFFTADMQTKSFLSEKPLCAVGEHYKTLSSGKNESNISWV